VVETLRRDGCLDPDPDTVDWLRFRERVTDPASVGQVAVIVVGQGRLASLVAGQGLFRDFSSARHIDPADLELAVDGTLDGPFGDTPLVVALSDQFDFDFLTAVDDRCAELGVRWISLHVDGGCGWLGPAVVPGATPNYRDLLGRRFCAARSAAQFHALTNPPVHGRPHLPPDPDLLWMLSILVAEVRRWSAGGPVSASWHEVELDPVTFAVTRHPVLPLPDRVGPRPERRFTMDMVVDERTGIVNRLDEIRTHPSVPGSLRIVQSVACDLRRISLSHNGRLNHGSSFSSPDVARRAAIAEGVERYCGNWIGAKQVIRASFTELTARGEHAVDPRRLVLHSPAQYAAPGFPLVPFTRDLPVEWVPGHCLTCDLPAWVPGSLVHVNWYLGRSSPEPQTNYAMFAGIAAGADWDMAVAAGIEELIERDTKMIWWLDAHRLPGVELSPELSAVWAGEPTRLGQRARLIYLENEFEVPVMAGVLENVQDNLLTIGFAARPDPTEAGMKAWAEALGLQEMARQLDDPDGVFWTVTTKLMGDEGLKRPRPDRRYLDECRGDFHDVNTLLAQLQINLDPRAMDLVRGWTDTDQTRPLESIPRLPDRTARTYRDRVERRGFEVFAVDLTTPDIDMAGMKVVRVVVPGLVPNLPSAFLPLGNRRVQDAPVSLGWRDRPREEGEVNAFPMPHA
jgi:ribosomal protein S12 methylthiotransferase accessory factor